MTTKTDEQRIEEFRQTFHKYQMDDPRDVMIDVDSGQIEDWLCTNFKEVREDEMKKIEKILISMSWQERNETPEAIRVLSEIKQALTTPK